MSFNLVVIEGRLGKDVESRATASGKKVVNFSIASDFGYGDNKGTLWDTVVAWGSQAEFAEKHLKKGSGVRITGERRSRSWDDAKSGEKKYATEIHVATIEFAGSKADSPETGQKPAGRAAAPTPTRTQAAPAVRAVVDDDPFGDGTGITDSDLPF